MRAVLGAYTQPLLEVHRARALVTTDRAILEVSRRIELGFKRPELLDTLKSVADRMIVVSVSTLADDIPQAQAALRDSVPSRNGSTSDAHILALAWAIDADVWTHDRDFAGAGVPTWSTINLLRALFGAT
jgi:predicted nucleic acid-binding protein